VVTAGWGRFPQVMMEAMAILEVSQKPGTMKWKFGTPNTR
jgi:hypothetical protein